MATRTSEQLLTNFVPPKKQARTNNTKSHSPSRNANLKCTRCTHAGAECIPNGGVSVTCRRCRKLKQKCDLPEKRHSSQRKQQRTLSKSISDMPPKPRKFLRTNGSTSMHKPENRVSGTSKGMFILPSPLKLHSDRENRSR